MYSFCSAFIRLTTPSMAQGFYSVNGEEEKKVEEEKCAYGAVRTYCKYLQMKHSFRIFITFILLSLLEASHQRNTRWYYPQLLEPCAYGVADRIYRLFNAFILLGLLEEAHRRNMRRQLPIKNLRMKRCLIFCKD